jgi:hypothetical protein
MKRFFVRSRHNCLQLSFLFVFVSLAECYDLENFGSPWRTTVVDVQTFQKKGKQEEIFADVKWMLS